MAFSRLFLDGENLTKDNFRNPPKKMGILPFWFWNGEMDEMEMIWQLKEYKDKGIEGLFLHGRFGESIGYLSDVWMERAKHAVKTAREIGIDIWIYDEMNWPSGTAYRSVPKNNPKHRQKYLEMVALPVPGPLFTFLEATDDRYVNTGDSKPIAAFACSEEEFNSGIKSLLDLMPNLSFNAVLPWEAPEGNWRLLYFLEKEIDYHIDTLNPESTKLFLDSTHEKYKKAVGEEFGKVVPGFYTDEPAMHYYHVGMQNQVIPWTSKMFKIFRERRGYDLKPVLPALFLDMGALTAKTRYDFWLSLTEQYSESYYEQIHNWCEKNGVLFTGHLLGEEWIWMHARCEGNIFKHLKHMHVTGVDHLYPVIGNKERADQHVAIKIASSAAHHYGSNRLLCESMGGTYWDCSLERMKWIANWEYVLGVNIFNNHGYHYSIEGERKRDWPPSQFYHHTWWKYYGQFTDYMSRLGHVLTGGKHVAKVLMLYPINTAWTNYKPSGPTDIFNTMQADFNYLTDALLRLHYDFDYTDEDILAGATVEDGKIKINDEEYSVFILPPVTHIQSDAFNLLKEFVEQGGNLIGCTFIPVELLNSYKKEDKKVISDLFGTDCEKLLGKYKSVKNPKLHHHTTKGNVFVIQSSGLSDFRSEELLKETLDKSITPDVTIDNENIFYLHRVKDGRDVYFFVNTPQIDQGRVEITFEKPGSPGLWDPNTGEIKSINVFKIENNRLVLSLDFPAAEARIVIIDNDLPGEYVEETNLEFVKLADGIVSGVLNGSGSEPYAVVNSEGKKKRASATQHDSNDVINLGTEFQYELDDKNVLLINRWKMSPPEMKVNPEEVIKNYFDDSDWLDVTMGAWEMQLSQERDEEIYPVRLWYRTSFEAEHLPESVKLLIDGFSGKDYLLFINGESVQDKGTRSKLDAEIKEIEIRSYMTKGLNRIVVRLDVTRRTDGILDLLKILGDFELLQNEGSYRMIRKRDVLKIGDWTMQGFPFYSGTVTYKSVFDIDSSYLNGRIFFKAECGEDVLEIVINGNSIVMPWHPYKTEITEYLKKGQNKIEIKVTNTLINTLEGVKKESGLMTEPEILHYHIYELC
ncbi:MAG: hypothetical protein JW995_03035 [Melioribacteraceae bacterium]|nr:hypothetical protein [Melioribacteraceae bacterium]